MPSSTRALFVALTSSYSYHVRHFESTSNQDGLTGISAPPQQRSHESPCRGMEVHGSGQSSRPQLSLSNECNNLSYSVLTVLDPLASNRPAGLFSTPVARASELITWHESTRNDPVEWKHRSSFAPAYRAWSAPPAGWTSVSDVLSTAQVRSLCSGEVSKGSSRGRMFGRPIFEDWSGDGDGSTWFRVFGPPKRWGISRGICSEWDEFD